MKSLQSRLQDIYKSQDEIPQLIEVLANPDKKQLIKDYYVKLKILLSGINSKQLVSNESVIATEKKDIELKDIFTAGDNNQNNKILILGGAGVGKTTLMQYVAYQWANDKLWHDKFDLVYKISFKQLLREDCKDLIQKARHQDYELEAFIAYNLANGNIQEANKLFTQIREIELNNKILLLVDGYDEVKHLDDIGVYQTIKKSIMSQDNVIMTTRPNAVEKILKSQFGVYIENVGLDDDGISNYLSKQFAGKPEIKTTMQNFLNTNPQVHEMCKVSINMAMLCSIVSESDDVNFEALENSYNMSDLYNQMVATLGKRFFEKVSKYSQSNTKKDLKEKLENGVFDVDELQVLEYIAYNAFTNQDTLIFKGIHSKIDTEHPTLQSAINYISKHRGITIDKRPTMTEVYKYGLLKTEELVQKASEMNETDLKEQLFSFIHLTFQEYLTAYEFKELLKGKNIQDTCKFIANNRDNPKYLMVLKFMSGLVSADTSLDAKNIRQAFWESMTCNIEGMIDLGENRKVELFMNLLGQVPKDKLKDIPNIERIQGFINDVVCPKSEQTIINIIRWQDTIKNSNYLSPKMQSEIFEFYQTAQGKEKSEVLQLIGKLIPLIDNKIAVEEGVAPYKYIAKILEDATRSEDNSILHQVFLVITKNMIFIQDEYETDQIKIITACLLEKIKDKSIQKLSSEVLSLFILSLFKLDKILEDAISDTLSALVEIINKTSPREIDAANYAVDVISKLPLDKLPEDVVSDNLKALVAIISKLGRKGGFAAKQAAAIGKFPLDKLPKDIVSNTLKALVDIITQKGGFAAKQTAAGAIGELTLDKLPTDLVSKEITKALKALVNILPKKEGLVDLIIAGAIGKLPLDKLPADLVLEEITKALKVLVAIIIQGGDYAISEVEAIVKLPLDKLPKDIVSKEITKALKALVNILPQGGDYAIFAVEAIGKLPLDKLPEDVVSDTLKALVNILPQGGDYAIFAVEAIRKLPLDKLPEDVVSDTLKALVNILYQRGFAALFIAGAIVKLPLNKLPANLVSEEIKKVLKTLVKITPELEENEIMYHSTIEIGKLPLDQLSEDVVSDTLKALVAILPQGGNSTIFAIEVIGKLPLDQLSEDVVSDTLKALVAIFPQGGNYVVSAVEVIGKLPLDKLPKDVVSKEITNALKSFVKVIHEEAEEDELMYSTIAMGQLPLDQLSEDVVSDTLKALVNILSIGEVSDKYAVEAIGKLPLNKLPEDLVSKEITKALKALVAILPQGGDYAISSVRAIGKLPLDKLPKDIVFDTIKILVAILPQGGDYAISAAEAIGKLPLDQLSEDVVSDTLKALVNILPVGEVSDKYAVEAIGKLPLDKLPEDLVSKEITKILVAIIHHKKGVSYKYAVEAIGKLPLDKLPKDLMSDILKALVAILPQVGMFDKCAVEAIEEIASNINIKNINILTSYINNDQLPRLTEKINQNITNNTSFIKGNFITINSLINLTKVIPFNLEGKKLTATIESVLKSEANNDDVKTNFALLHQLEENIDSISVLAIGRQFLENVYEKILEDNELTDVNSKLIVALIKNGFTTSITDQDVLIVNGQKHKISDVDENSKKHLFEITKAIIDFVGQGQEEYKGKLKIVEQKYNLAAQYRDHIPIFSNSSQFVLKSSSDIVDKDVSSLFNRDVKLDSIVVTSFKDENIVYVEDRDAFGKHWIIKYENGKRIEGFDIHQNPLLLACDHNGTYTDAAIERLENIFGQYHGKNNIQKYYKILLTRISKSIAKDKLEELIKESTLQREFKPEQEKLLFHQTLVGRGDNDRQTNMEDVTSKVKETCDTLSNDQRIIVKDVNTVMSEIDELIVISSHDSDINLKQLGDGLVPGIIGEIVSGKKSKDQGLKEIEEIIKKDHINQVVQRLENQIMDQQQEINSFREIIEQARTDVSANNDVIEEIAGFRADNQDNDSGKEESLASAEDSSNVYLATATVCTAAAAIALYKYTKNNDKCTIFSATDIVYDNELLNHPEIFNKLAGIYGVNETLDLSSSISSSLINEAIQDNNVDLLMGAIISLDTGLEL